MSQAPSQRILLVEDQALLAKVVEGLLVNAGFTVDHAENGGAAVDKLQAGTYGLLITDLMMPVMDGVQLVAWVREESALSLPIIVLSANSDARHTERLMALGVQAILKKPLDMDHFVDHVRQCLGCDD